MYSYKLCVRSLTSVYGCPLEVHRRGTVPASASGHIGAPTRLRARRWRRRRRRRQRPALRLEMRRAAEWPTCSGPEALTWGSSMRVADWGSLPRQQAAGSMEQGKGLAARVAARVHSLTALGGHDAMRPELCACGLRGWPAVGAGKEGPWLRHATHDIIAVSRPQEVWKFQP